MYVWNSQTENMFLKNISKFQCMEKKVCCYLVISLFNKENYNLTQTIFGLLKNHKMCVYSVPGIKGI